MVGSPVEGAAGGSGGGGRHCLDRVVSSPYVRERVNDTISETARYEQKNEANSSGVRIDFWTKSIGIVERAPLFGHGTGSIPDQFRRAAAGQGGASAPFRPIPIIKPSLSAFSLALSE